jgi:hypothetical protein
MKIGQCNVFLLSILRNIDKINTSPVQVIEFIENFSFQYSAICKSPGNKVEKLYSKYAVQIETIVNDTGHSKHIKGNIQRCFQTMMNDFKGLLPNEQTFIDNFAKLTYNKSQSLSKYVLTRINESMQITNEQVIDSNNVNIEHILPQKPIKWGLDQAEVSPYVHLLGNLTLLNDSFNRSIGNEPLADKLKQLKKSQLDITKDFVNRLSDDKTWSEDQIRDRQARFGKLAYDEIWNI